MKARILYMAILPLMAAVACSKVEPVDVWQSDGTGIDITVRTVSADRVTKAETQRDGITELNENRIMSVDFFIYVNGQLDAPITYGHLDTEVEAVKKFKVDLKGASFDAVFNGGTSAVLYSIANYPENAEYKLTGNESIEQLKQIVVKAAEFAGEKHIMDSFVMSGQSTVEKKSDIYGEGTIELQRVVAKFTVTTKFDKEIFEEEVGGAKKYWKPYITEDRPVSAKFFYGNKYGTLDSGKRVPRTTTYADSLFTSDSRVMSDATNAALITDRLYAPDAFYTCARSWDYGDVDEPYLLITVYEIECDASGNIIGDGPLPCYYKVLLSAKSFEMNHWYDIDLSLVLLGSWTPDVPKVITSDYYYVVDWNGYSGEEGPGTTATVVGARFLQMNEHEYNVYSANTLEIPYATSHAVTVTSVTCKHIKYDVSSGEFITDPNPSTTGVFTPETVNGSTVIKFNHPLHLEFNENMDTTPYEYTVTIWHTDDHNYTETFTLTQYPPIMTSAELNDSRGDSFGSGDRDKHGNVYVNGQVRYYYSGAPAGDQNANGAYYNTLKGHTPENMYIIETKTLPAGDQFKDYIITDPRTTTPNKAQIPYKLNNGGDDFVVLDPDVEFKVKITTRYTSVNGNPGSASGPALYGDSPRKEMYYYATMTTEESENYISPKFRIASNYCGNGNSGQSYYYDMVYRCASYQEAGFPAGRWRLPTVAEIQYVVKLQQNNLINDEIFQVDGSRGYFAATAPCPCSNNLQPNYDEINNSYSVRCVYDDWYWENTDGRVQNTSATVNGATKTLQTTKGRLPESSWNTFVWGDMPR